MSNLNTSNFKTVFDDNFTKDTSLNTSLWSAHWGNSSEYDFTGTSAGLVLTGSQSTGWVPVGFEQAPSGKSAGEGYGLYSFTGYAGQAGQGVGICFVLWPADNVWLPSSKPGVATEIDLLESWNGTKSGVSTIHYYSASASGHNGQTAHTLSGVDLTKSHTYSIDWERGSLTYYVDGVQFYQDTTHVPLDAADGGVNETMGAEVVNEAAYVTTSTVKLNIQEMSYSAPVSGTTSVTPTATPTITLSAPGTVQEASSGAGVTISESITTTNLSGNVYVEVLTSGGAVESTWATVPITGGKATASIHLAKTGDFIRAVDSTSSPTVTTNSSAVTITDAATTTTPTPSSPTPTTSGIVISSLSEDSGRLLMGGDKETGAAATLREYMDGKYLGVLRDGFPDGTFSMHIADVAAGSHVLKLTVDGSSATAVYDFTKLASGSVTHTA